MFYPKLCEVQTAAEVFPGVMTETDHPSCSNGLCPKRPPTGGRGELAGAMNFRGKAVPGGLTWIALQDEPVSVFFLQDPHQGRGQFRTGYVTLGL